MEKKKVKNVPLRGKNQLAATLDDKADWVTFLAQAMQDALARKKAAGKAPPP